MSEHESEGVWRPLGDAWTTDSAQVDATIAAFMDDAHLQLIEAGLPERLLPIAMSKYEATLRQSMLSAIASCQAQLRAELDE